MVPNTIWALKSRCRSAYTGTLQRMIDDIVADGKYDGYVIGVANVISKDLRTTH